MLHLTISSLPSESEYFSKILYSSFSGNKIATPLLAEVLGEKMMCPPPIHFSIFSLLTWLNEFPGSIQYSLVFFFFFLNGISFTFLS